MAAASTFWEAGRFNRNKGCEEKDHDIEKPLHYRNGQAAIGGAD